MTSTNKPTIAIAIASAGRRDILTEVVAFMANQSCAPGEFIICPAKPEDANVDALKVHVPGLHIVNGPVGSSAQRNTIIAASDSDIMVFFDDDFLPAANYLEQVERLFASDESIVIATGHVIADGIIGPGLEFDEAKRILAEDRELVPDMAPTPVYNGYGCNMAVRMSIVRDKGIRFDENLPLYAWLEDVDFSRQLAPFGRIVKSDHLRGVHMGTKRSGRSPGRRLGYSQVANPIYIAMKGTMTWSRALSQIARNLLANSYRCFSPEPWVDRKGRFLGNLMAIGDIIVGRLNPSRILSM